MGNRVIADYLRKFMKVIIGATKFIGTEEINRQVDHWVTKAKSSEKVEGRGILFEYMWGCLQPPFSTTRCDKCPKRKKCEFGKKKLTFDLSEKGIDELMRLTARDLFEEMHVYTTPDAYPPTKKYPNGGNPEAQQRAKSFIKSILRHQPWVKQNIGMLLAAVQQFK